MAPRAYQATSTVFTAQVKSHDKKAILVEAGGITPVRWFLEKGSQPQSSKEPPRKRQKIDHINEDAHSIDKSDHIPLLSACVDFHFPETLNTKSASAEAIANDVDFTDALQTSVILQYVEDEDGGAKFHISLPQPKGPLLLIESDAMPENVLSTLRRITQYMATTPTQRSKQQPASVSSCTLTRSVGPLFTVVRLSATLHWLSGKTALPDGPAFRKSNTDQTILAEIFPDPNFEHNDKPWTPQEFYESVPATSNDDNMEGMYRDVLESDLFPFQKRAVKWMLSREDRASQAATPHFCEPVKDLEGNTCFVNRLQGVLSREPSKLGTVDGGALFEEMGLGKTIELLALISLNQRPARATRPTSERAQEPSLQDLQGGDPSGESKESSLAKYLGEAEEVRDDYSGDTVTTSRATLIITPRSILQQWQSELARHAPALQVFHYEGIPGNKADAPSHEQIITDLTTKYDVVLATYATLGREIHFAEDPPDRKMRNERKFERKRSPLVQIQWWRVCLDEAQMVESGVTAAAKVACRLPRIHSWAVTGTPLKKNVQDLHGLLIFLRYYPFNGQNGDRIWRRLVDHHRPLFRSIFNCMALRHTKWHLRNELQLPAQKRVVVTTPFTVVEQQHYSSLFEEMCAEVGVDHNGSPLTDHYDPEDPGTIEAMRTFLTRLRQTCLHPQVGGRNRRALGRGTQAGPLRTVAEVLAVMIEQNENSLRVDERAVVSAALQKAHILGNNKDDDHRSEKALEIYKEVHQTVTKIVEEARQRLAAAEAAHDESSTQDNEDEDGSTPLLGKLRNALRTALQLQHTCAFFTATSYFQIKSTQEEGSDEFKRLEELETTYYDTAKQLRKEVLAENSQKAEAFMVRLQSEGPTQLPPMNDLRSLGGIESRRIVEKSNELFDVITAQQEVLEDWRKTIVKLLLKPLIDEENPDDDAMVTGEEYEDSTKQQDELFVYFDAFKAVCADLTTFITGETAPLIDWEAQQYVKHCKRWFDDKVMEEHKQFVHAPELGLKLFKIRQKYRDERDSVGSIRGLIQEARALESSMDWNRTRTASEHAIIKQHIAALQSIFTASTKALTSLEHEEKLYRQMQNQRVEFYRQLQELSDDVAPYKEELDDTLDAAALGVAVAKEDRAKHSLAESQKKNRFLLHLREETGAQSGPRVCIICTSSFESGVLTVCGHQFCKECINQWFTQVRTCPMCKRKLTSANLHEITFKPRELRAQEEKPDESSQSDQRPSSSSNEQPASIYSDMDAQIMDEIKSIDLPNSFGSKIDGIGRHLKWIREHDPGAKSIVFSQFREFLDVLGIALKDFKLGSARLGRPGAVEKFRHDPSIDCLLLDAKTDSSGLTLVNATHVFICEPLIQTAVELQAIARVHRIGQTRATTVWMYLINDTVEQAIYEISVKRRLEHVQSRQKQKAGTGSVLQETAIDDANTEELQAAPLTKLLAAGKSGGELVEKDDLWQCLFGKAKTGHVSEAAQREVGRHLRGEAAAERGQVKD